MAETTTLCVSVQAGEHLLSGPDWLKVENTKTLIDVLVEVSGTQALGYQVQVIVSKEPNFTEAALMQIVNCVSMLRSSGSIYVKFLLKSSVLPSNQRYQETKCKAERDTDSPSIESFLKPTNEGQQKDHISDVLDNSTEKPFESNYLNKLLSEQKLSPSTLSSLKRELVKKKLYKESDHYTTWQKESITSPVNDFQSFSINNGQHLPHKELTNWADECEVKECEKDVAHSKVPENSENAQHNQQKDNGHKFAEEDNEKARKSNLANQKADRSSNENSAKDTTSGGVSKGNTKQKDQSKKVSIRKTIVPKTNRSTALRVKKNSASCAGLQKGNKNESSKSGMPILSQQTTRSTLCRPKETLRSKFNLSKVKENQTKGVCVSSKKSTPLRSSIIKKEAKEKPASGFKKNRKEEGCLESKSRDKEKNYGIKKVDGDPFASKKEMKVHVHKNTIKEEEFYGKNKTDAESHINSKKNCRSVDYEQKETNNARHESESIKSEDHKHATEEVFGQPDTDYQLDKEETFEKSVNTGSLQRSVYDGSDCNIQSDENNEIENGTSQVLAKTDNVFTEASASSVKQHRKEDNNPKQSSGKLNTISTEIAENKIIVGNGMTLSESEVTSTPNPSMIQNKKHAPVFSFTHFESNCLQNEAGDSFDEVTIYETQNPNSITEQSKEAEITVLDGLDLISRTAEVSSTSFTDWNAVADENGTNFNDESSFSDCRDQATAKEPLVTSVSNDMEKNCLGVFQNKGSENKVIGEDRLLLQERSRFFQALSNHSSQRLKSSFDSLDFIESSEMQRKSSINGINHIRRSESLDRYAKGALPKKSGFFHDLKERTMDANTGCLSAGSLEDVYECTANPFTDHSIKKLSMSLALDHDKKGHSIRTGGLDAYTKPSPNRDRSHLNKTIDKLDSDEKSTSSTFAFKSERKSCDTSPSFMADIGRESAASRTFSLEDDHNGENLSPKEVKKEKLSPGIGVKATLDVTSGKSEGQNKADVSAEKTIELETNQHSKDDVNIECNIDFGRDVECHIRRKWNLQSDIIDQLLLSSLNDQCQSLNATAQRILSSISAPKDREENPFEELQRASSDATKQMVGETGKLFKALQSLEKQLIEIENNLGTKLD